MDKYEQICKLNLQYDILPITDSSFIKYGKIYDDLDLMMLKRL